MRREIEDLPPYQPRSQTNPPSCFRTCARGSLRPDAGAGTNAGGESTLNLKSQIQRAISLRRVTRVTRPSWPCFHGLEAHTTAQAGGRRYYKAYLAEGLDGQWIRQQLGPQPGSIGAGARKDKPFAGPANMDTYASNRRTRNIGAHWTDSFTKNAKMKD